MATNPPQSPSQTEPTLSSADDQLFMLAVSHLQRQEPSKAIPILEQFVKRITSHAAAWSNLAFAYNETEQFNKAVDAARRALATDPTSMSAKANLGLALRGVGTREAISESSQLLEAIYREQPGNGQALFNVCLSRFDRGEFGQALEGFTVCRKAFGDDPKILENIAACQIKLQNFSQAATVLSSLLAQPGLSHVQRAKGFHDLGVIAMEQGDNKTALAHYKKALGLTPSFCEALVHQGIAQNALGSYDQALKSFQQAFSLNPAFPFLLGRLAHQKMLCADWGGLDELATQLNEQVLAGKPASEPFGYQAISTDPKALMACAKVFSEHQYPRAGIKSDMARHLKSGADTSRISLGFVSGEFRDQATSMLIVGLLEQINREQFSVTLFDNGWSDNSAIRKRLEDSCEIVPIRSLDDAQAIAIIKQRQIDVLFNLNGFFGEMRHNLFIERAAPVQINYLGFPGTLGVANMDFIIGDATVIPEADEAFYSEHVLRMPASYQCTDHRRDRPVLSKTKAELGLTLEGQDAPDPFVFCCFNNTYKITPAIFNAWMKILAEVPNSVLWLLETHTSAKENLRQVAKAKGIDPNRLVFAPRTNPQDHLARHAAADLILDTTPYNAHTTASDALWMGVPLLTIKGTTFPGRVGESLLRAVGFSDELIAEDLDDYIAKAIGLANQPNRITALKAQLEESRLRYPLFDTARYARDFEALIQSACS